MQSFVLLFALRPIEKEKKNYIPYIVRTAFYLFYIIFSREMLTIKSLPARWNEYFYKRTKVVKVEDLTRFRPTT